MKKWILYAAGSVFMLSYIYGCSPKYGCPADGKSMGAERLLSSDKPPKAKKFKD